MSEMNVGRMIAGGLAAGIVINAVESVMNVVVLASDMQAAYQTMGLAEPAGSAIAGFLGMGFVLGILVAWLYAAVRPRLGAGPRTAVIAGLFVWIAACAIPTVGWALMGIPGLNLPVVLAYTLVEMVVAALVAGAIYKEHGPAM